MLRKIRIAAAAFFFVLTTLLFLDFTGTLHAWLGWMAKIQFLPALLALNVGVVAFLVILTLLFGRVYCSVICPLGVMQDVISWASGKRRKHRNRFAYSPALTWLRRGMLVVFVAAMLAGIGSLLAPYSAYGRIASNLLAPVYAWGNNLLAYIAERMDSYAFYSVDVWMKGLSTFLVAVVLYPRVAQRAHVLQYGLSGGYGAGISRPLLAVQAALRRLEVQRLQALRPQLQGLVHRPCGP